MQPALVPVPLRHLVNCHTYLLSYLHFLRVGPDGLLVELLAQDLHLPLFLAHAVAFPPLFHVFLILFLSDLRQILRFHLTHVVGPLDCPLLGIGAHLIVLAERHVSFHAPRAGCLDERSTAALARHGPCQLRILLFSLFGLSLSGLAGVRDYRGLTVHQHLLLLLVRSVSLAAASATATHLHFVLGGDPAGWQVSKDAVVFEIVCLFYWHKALVVFRIRVVILGALLDLPVAIDAQACASPGLQGWRFRHGDWVEY